MRKVKVWAGSHPDEKLALDFSRTLKQDPIPNVDTGIVNELAYQQQKRLVDKNMMHAYPGNESAGDYETVRAAQVLQESRAYDVVIDLHNLSQYGESVGVISPEQGVTPTVLGFLGHLAINTIIVDNTAGMHPHLVNALAIEMSPSLHQNTNAFRCQLDVLANNPDPPQASPNEFSWFRFIDSLHVDHLDPRTASGQIRQIVPLEPLPPVIDRRFRRDKTFLGNKALCAMAWTDQPNEQGYWGEVVTPIECPDTSTWPEK